jgi:hypothetical protein
MSLLSLFGRKDRPELRSLVETDVPEYKGLIPDHTNHTRQIMDALKADRKNQIPYETFAKFVRENPKYAIRVSMEKSIEGTDYPTLRLLGGESYNPEHEIFINTISGKLDGKDVEPVEEQTFDSIFEYTEEFHKEKHNEEKGFTIEKESTKKEEPIQETDSTSESEPKSIF